MLVKRGAIAIAATVATMAALTGGAQAQQVVLPSSGLPKESVLQSALLHAPPAKMTLLEQGLQYSQAKRYTEAEACLRQSSIEHPEDPLPHYYLANIYVFQHRHRDAVREYQTSYILDPYSVVSGYCRKALVTYKAAVPEVGGDNKGDKEAGIISAADKLNIGAKNSALLRSQVEREKDRSRSSAEQAVNSVKSEMDAKTRRIKEAAAIEADSILHPPVGSYLHRYNQSHPEEAVAAANKLKADADENVKIEKAFADMKASGLRQSAKDQAKALDDVANNLQRQIGSKAQPGSAQLHEEGTGLFVRYYGRPPGAAPEVHSSFARLVRIQTPLHSPEPREPEKTDNADDQADSQRTVRGAVIK